MRTPPPSCTPSLLHVLPQGAAFNTFFLRPTQAITKPPFHFPSVWSSSPGLVHQRPQWHLRPDPLPGLSFLCPSPEDASRIMLRSVSGLQGQVQILRFSTETPPNVTLAPVLFLLSVPPSFHDPSGAPRLSRPFMPP